MNTTQSPSLSVDRAAWSEYENELKALRTTIFIQEQNVPEEEEWDELDSDASTIHLLALWESKPVGTVRLLASGQIGRLCVLEGYRERGIAQQLLRQALNLAFARQQYNVFLFSQIPAIPLYERFGFRAEGNTFMDAGIPHKKMNLSISGIEQLVTLYGDSVQRFSSLMDFQFHLKQMTFFGRREMVILTRDLSPAMFSDTEFVEHVSELARRSRYSEIRILIQDTKPLVGVRHPLIELAQRLPTKIIVRKCTLEPKNKEQGFIIVDREQLLFLNDERECYGFMNYSAKAESLNLLDDYNYLWQRHSAIEENFQRLHM